MMMRQNLVLKLAAAVGVTIAFTGVSRAATAVSPAVAATIDSDGDGVNDLFFGNSFDNAPNVPNLSQEDLDGDQYGDADDPDINHPGPAIDIGFDVGPAVHGTYFTTVGAGVNINFTTIDSPPGDFGHINLLLGATSVGTDAVAFQSLATPGGSFFIPANVFTAPVDWDLNTPGTYTLHAFGTSPGEILGTDGGIATVVVVTPEPASLALIATVVACGVRRRR